MITDKTLGLVMAENKEEARWANVVKNLETEAKSLVDAQAINDAFLSKAKEMLKSSLTNWQKAKNLMAKMK